MQNLIRARKTPSIRDLWSGPLLDRSFRVSISLKGLHALLETIVGIALLKIDPQMINRFMSAVRPFCIKSFPKIRRISSLRT